MEYPAVIVKLDNLRTLQDVVAKLTSSANLDERPEKKEWPMGDTLKKRWKTIDGETFGVNEISVGEKEKYKYVLINAYVERVRQTVKDDDGQFLDRSDRVNTVESDVLFFENSDHVFAVIYMNLTTSNLSKINYILKDLLKEDVWGTHTFLPTEYHISDSIYYWILNKFIFGDKKINLEHDMSIRTFTGYNGVSAIDESHTMIGDGERISALLVTLAFIFGDDSLKALKIHITFNGDNNILFELSYKGNVRTLEFDGDYFGDTSTEEKILSTLVIYQKIIPVILDTYSSEKKSDKWNEDIKQEFLKKVGTIIIERVQKKIDGDEKFSAALTNRETAAGAE